MHKLSQILNELSFEIGPQNVVSLNGDKINKENNPHGWNILRAINKKYSKLWPNIQDIASKPFDIQLDAAKIVITGDDGKVYVNQPAGELALLLQKMK
jgi:hypothetical protein